MTEYKTKEQIIRAHLNFLKKNRPWTLIGKELHDASKEFWSKELKKEELRIKRSKKQGDESC